jgi:hypothetical protein
MAAITSIVECSEKFVLPYFLLQVCLCQNDYSLLHQGCIRGRFRFLQSLLNPGEDKFFVQITCILKVLFSTTAIVINLFAITFEALVTGSLTRGTDRKGNLLWSSQLRSCLDPEPHVAISGCPFESGATCRTHCQY